MSAPTERPVAANFVRDLVQRRHRAGHLRRARADPVPTRAERLPAHRPRQGDLRSTSASPPSSAASCNLRFDDTNPDTEEIELRRRDHRRPRAGSGSSPASRLYASDYFEQLYEWAELLITDGKAYVDDQDGETISAQRGGYGKPGIESPYRDRPRRGEPRPVPADARRRVRRRVARAARQDRHAAREHAAARSGDVPHPSTGTTTAPATRG